MTLCPYAIALSCSKCPIKRVCPLKGVIGDAKKPDQQQDSNKEKSSKD